LLDLEQLPNKYERQEIYMKLWGGRFTKEINQLVHNFNASISFDQKFYKQDIKGSIAHVTMLASTGILTEEEKVSIVD
jgi:argininosuccinate lyase